MDGAGQCGETEGRRRCRPDLAQGPRHAAAAQPGQDRTGSEERPARKAACRTVRDDQGARGQGREAGTPGGGTEEDQYGPTGPGTAARRSELAPACARRAAEESPGRIAALPQGQPASGGGSQGEDPLDRGLHGQKPQPGTGERRNTGKVGRQQPAGQTLEKENAVQDFHYKIEDLQVTPWKEEPPTGMTGGGSVESPAQEEDDEEGE
ncbi:hypothetical protein [Plasmodium yoelii yoelii]|uniref:Uncharacterized protein n=1 Tax=Plasmodium yoelii yoelii TaxID=73239 RepID=Q7R6Y6_PLAYO|nr:hypothetical protein [Plasmodium yoelii yoelii]